MGTSHSGAPARPDIPRSQRFSARFLSHVFTERGVSYDFIIESPDCQSLPGQLVSRSFPEFQELDYAMGLRHRHQSPPLPASTIFEHTDAAFLSERAAGLQDYLEALLQLEPLPRTQALRRFLRIAQPLTFATGPASAGFCACGPFKLPNAIVSGSLAFLEPLDMLRACRKVCRAMRAAAASPSCWPSLSFCSGRAELFLEGLLQLLLPTASAMKALSLDLAFESPQLAVALPAGMVFRSLTTLRLRVGDAEAAGTAADLLACVEASLKELSLEGCGMTYGLLSALAHTALSCLQLETLRVRWEPEGHRPVYVEEAEALLLSQLLLPQLKELELGVAAEGLGVSRCLAPLQPPHVNIPNTQPLLAESLLLGGLRHLTFSFLSDDALVCIRELDDRALPLQSARFSGNSTQLAEPNEVLVLLLSKLGDELQSFEFFVEVEPEVRPFATSFLRERIGPLPGQFQNRGALRSLLLNWTAFDCEGVRCIVENCPQLHTLLLDRAEYWTDETVHAIVTGLPELRRLRVRSSSLLSDQALYHLASASLEHLELEVSFSMSSFAVEQLASRMEPMGSARTSFDPAAGALCLMAAVAGMPDPLLMGAEEGAPLNGTMRLLKPLAEEDVLPPLQKRRGLHIGRF